MVSSELLYLQTVLDDPLGRELFRAFCISEKNVEVPAARHGASDLNGGLQHLMFWLQVKNYRALHHSTVAGSAAPPEASDTSPCTAELAESACDIFENFLDEDRAPAPVLIDHDCTARVNELCLSLYHLLTAPPAEGERTAPWGELHPLRRGTSTSIRNHEARHLCSVYGE